jgi:rare lipoprotein A (peptidoglycan hydrolase)
MRKLLLLPTLLLLAACTQTNAITPSTYHSVDEKDFIAIIVPKQIVPCPVPVFTPAPTTIPIVTPTVTRSEVITKPKKIITKPKVKISTPRVQSSGWRTDSNISWYGPGFYGHRTACGLTLTKTLIGVAHRTLPCGTLITFKWSGRIVAAPVVDRGPYVGGRQFDMTGGLCVKLNHCFTGKIYYRIGR